MQREQFPRLAISALILLYSVLAWPLSLPTITGAQEPPELSRTETNGARLAYLVRGQGHAVVLVHGTLADHRLWTPLLDSLAQKYRVVSYSRRYHHANAALGPGGDGSDYSFALHAADLSALIRRLQLGQVHVVGHSTGAVTALLLARQNPELVRTLVLGEPGLRSLLGTSPADTALAADELEGTIEPTRQALRRDDLLGAVRAFVDGRNARPGVFDQMPAPARARLMENASALKAELLLGPGLPAFTCSDARDIKAPTLLLIGGRSLPFFHRITEELSRCLPKSERATIPGVPHGGIFSANADAAKTAILEFLERPSR